MTIRAGGTRRRRKGGRWWRLPLWLCAPYLGFFAFVSCWAQYPLAGGPEGSATVRGAYHVHSTRSDGRGTVEEIAQAARASGLQFVVLADHNQPPEPPRYIEGVLVIYGVELSTPTGHVVALGLPRALTGEERAAGAIATVRQLGGTSFIAHPEQKKQPWTDWEAAEFAQGLELYSADSMFRTAQRSPFSVFLPAVVGYLANPIHGLLTVVSGQPEVTSRLLARTDPPQVAMCAHDAHGLPFYEDTFRALALYLPELGGSLDADPVAAERAVVAELGAGRGYCAFRGIAGGEGFSIEGLSTERTASVGDRLEIRLPAGAPEPLQIRVWGPASVEEDGRTVRLTGAGAVQLEVWVKVPGLYLGDPWRPWLVPSPFRVHPAPPGQ
jgi:hypothetical protein